MARKLQLRKFYKHKSYDGIWMLVSCDWNQLKLINLETGSRWGQELYKASEFEEIQVKFTVVNQ